MLESLKSRFEEQHIQYLILDGEGKVVESDNRLFPLNQGEVLAESHPFFHSIHAVDKDGYTEFNCVHLTLGGKAFTADLWVQKIPRGYFVVVMDLSSHYESYQATAQARNESVIARELVLIKNRELEEREKFKNQFIRNFSHELRNPLTSIVAMTNVLAGTELKEDQKKMINFIRESNANLRQMLEDVLSLNMIAVGKLAIRKSVFDFSQFIALLKFTYETRAKTRGLRFVCETDPDIPAELEGDRLRLFQVLTNLLDNAFRYTEEGEIRLRASLNQKWANKASLRFEVEDTGPGIPEEKQASIFESFSQIHPGASKGTGLGLAIVKNILELMGSEIKLDSREGSGARFYFDLSLTYPLGLQSTPAVKKPQSADKVKETNTKHRLLLVEDDIRVQTAVFKSLTDTGMFYVDLVNDGGLVIQELMNTEYDLVLMDVDLPTTSGDQLTRIIRDLPFAGVKDIPIIGLTANAFEDTITRCLNSGMQEVITKPYEEHHLLDAIKSSIK